MNNPLDEHSDAAFFTRFGLVIGALVTLSLVFGVIAHALESGTQASDDARVIAEIDKRTAPIAQAITSSEQLALVTPAPAASSQPLSGEQVVQQVCGACHGTGLLGAPKSHDHAAWKQRMAQNGGKLEGLVASAAKGKNQMPPRGGQPTLSDEDLKKAIETMMN